MLLKPVAQPTNMAMAVKTVSGREYSKVANMRLGNFVKNLANAESLNLFIKISPYIF